MKVNIFPSGRVCWFAAIVAVGAAYSQVNNASLSGLVNDASQGVISGVSVTVKNNSTNVKREVKTDGAGYYSFATLPVGDYEVSVAHPGFQTAVERVTLQTAQKARLDFSLTVGQVGTTVEVESAAPQLSPDDATLGTVVDNSYVSKFPLTLRSWDDLLNLVAGVQGSRYTEQSGATSAGRPGGFNVHGVRSLQNNFILDGVDNHTERLPESTLGFESSKRKIESSNCRIFAGEVSRVRLSLGWNQILSRLDKFSNVIDEN